MLYYTYADDPRLVDPGSNLIHVGTYDPITSQSFAKNNDQTIQ